MDIENWLRGLGLQQYITAFRDNAIDEEVLPELTEADLEKLGVLLGHRKRLLRAIAALAAPATAVPSPQVEPVPSSGDGAERRQLTVMFCDLVGSTALAARLDPEDMREVIGTYQVCVADLMRQHEGFVAKYMGDGALVYFGYPQAYENDAERAVRAGLALVERVAQLNIASERLQIRVGIATGLVVVGGLIGSGEAQERGVVGETPNLAARLQALAKPGSVVIAETTRRLTGRLFEYEDLGAVELKGFAQPVQVCRVLGESAVVGRFEALRSRETPLVGREEELELLLRRWEQVRGGEGRVVLLSGEPGIGKSRLATTLIEHVSGISHRQLRYSCSPHHGQNPLYPVISQLKCAAGFEREDTADQKRARLNTLLASSSLSAEEKGFLAELLTVPGPDGQAALNLSPQKRKARTLAALVHQLEAIARHEPVLMLWEDVHWIDPTSRELLDLFVARSQDLPVLLVITFRPEFVPTWIGQAHVTTLALNRLGRRQNAALVEQVTGGKALPPELMDQIVSHTDGVPLFIEELTKAVLESGFLREQDGRYVLGGPLPPLAVPTTLQDSLMARLDRLAPVREVAQVGAAIGREFPYELLAAVTAKPEIELQDALTQLTSGELVFVRGQPPEATYTFKHALVQDAAYSTLLRGKRQQLHARIAKALESRFPNTVETEPALLAHHCAQAGLIEKAVHYRLQAGELAIKRWATAEAVAQVTTGLQLLASLPEGAERQRHELALQLVLGPALLAAKGLAAPEMGRAYARARELSHKVGEPFQVLSALQGLFTFHVNLSQLDVGRIIADEVLLLAEQQGDLAFQAAGSRMAGVVSLFQARFAAAVGHFERAVSISDTLGPGPLAFSPTDPRVMCRAFLAWALLCSGHPETALMRSREALARAYELSHAFTLAHALHVICIFHQLRGDWPELERPSGALTTVAADQGFPYFVATGTIFQGWAKAAGGEVETGLANMHRGLAAKRATGAEIKVPYYLGLLAGLYGAADRVTEALPLLDEALATVSRTGECWFEAELHRLKGEVLLKAAPEDPSEAEACYRRAIAVAREQGARHWELRAATSLARLWCDRGQCTDARDYLAPVYNSYTEGFDTPDLKDAQELLEVLR